MSEGEGNERADALLFEEKEEEKREGERVACLPRIHFQDSSSYRPPSLPLPPPLAFCVTFDPERKTADCADAAFALARPTDGTAAKANGVKRL